MYPEANERDLKAVAQEAQGVQDNALLARGDMTVPLSRNFLSRRFAEAQLGTQIGNISRIRLAGITLREI